MQQHGNLEPDLNRDWAGKSVVDTFDYVRWELCEFLRDELVIFRPFRSDQDDP